MTIVLLILLFSAIITFELPRLLHKDRRRELMVFSFLLALGFSLCLGQALDLPIPSPARIIAAILRISY
jgi:hypothetical protein